MTEQAPLVTHKWFPGGHLFYYVAYPLGMQFTGIGELNDLLKFLWFNKLQRSIKEGSDAYFITGSNNFTDPNEIYAKVLRKTEKPYKIEQKRNGKVARYWYVYRLRNANYDITSSELLGRIRSIKFIPFPNSRAMRHFSNYIIIP